MRASKWDPLFEMSRRLHLPSYLLIVEGYKKGGSDYEIIPSAGYGWLEVSAGQVPEGQEEARSASSSSSLFRCWHKKEKFVVVFTIDIILWLGLAINEIPFLTKNLPRGRRMSPATTCQKMPQVFVLVLFTLLLTSRPTGGDWISQLSPGTSFIFTSLTGWCLINLCYRCARTAGGKRHTWFNSFLAWYDRWKVLQSCLG